VNNFGFNEQKIEASGQTQTCFTLHKRKNMKRLDKKERFKEAVAEKEDLGALQDNT